MRQAATAALAGPSIDDVRWLTGPEGETWLARAAALDGELAAKIDRLRSELSAGRTSLVLATLELRRRAGEKFSAAERMFFTPIALEQATDEIVAAYKAARFAAGPRVIDLCCGIGGDLLALARRGPARGVERDPACALFAQANARTIGDAARRPQVQIGDAREIDPAEGDAWHIDPDRRPYGRRTTRVTLHEPDAAAIDRLLARQPHAAVKLAPAAEWPEHWTDAAEMEWISRRRQCRQLVAWFGSLAREPGQRRATVLGHDQRPLGTLVGMPGDDVPLAPRIERYVFEPDPAVLAAKLEAALAGRHGLAAVAAGVAYWTGPRPIAEPLAASFEVDDVLPLDVKRLKAALRRRKIGRLEIKVRGAEQDPNELRRRLRVDGDNEATLLVTRISARTTAILARRVLMRETSPD